MTTYLKAHPRTSFIVSLVLSLIVLMGIVRYAGGYVDSRMTIINTLLLHWLAPEFTTWQYGLLVPPIIGWLIWQRREEILKQPVAGSFWGLGLMLFALVIYLGGYQAINYYFGFVSIQLFVAGAILWSLGWAHMKELTFPWLVLGTMWPLVFLEDWLGFPLRMISHHGVSALVNTLGLPITSEGSTFLSTSDGHEIGSWMTLQVEGKCSGMNTLFALMFAALLFSYQAQKTFWKRALLFSFSIPLAVLGNMVRIGLLMGGCALFGQDFAVGNEEQEMSSYHFLAGLIVFVVAYLGLQLISSWMDNRDRSRPQVVVRTRQVGC